MIRRSKNAVAGALVSARASTGMVAATFAQRMRGWGPQVALVAALLLMGWRLRRPAWSRVFALPDLVRSGQ